MNRIMFLTITVFTALIILINVSVYSQGSANVVLLSNFDPYPSVGYNDCWGYTAPDGREYALLGVLNGTSIIDITIPETPVESAFIPGPQSTWKDIKTYQHYAYVVTESSGGLQIIDLSDLPGSAALVNTYTGSGFQTSHNISIDVNNGILYAEGEGGIGIRVIDLADPVNPVQLTTMANAGVHDIFVQNNIAYVSEGWPASYSIWDVSSPANPSLLQRFFSPTGGYAHNAWATEDGNYLMTTEEVPANLTTKIWNIQNLSNITLVGEYIASENGRPHNAHVKGNFVYLSHYWDGLRILNITNPDSIFEEGFYDTFPNSGGSFEGDWGAYPFFTTGKVLISDRTFGLFTVYFEGADETLTGISDGEVSPESFSVAQNYPNPFNPSTTIRFNLPKESFTTLSVYNTLGQKVRTLVNGNRAPGDHEIIWDGRNYDGNLVNSGVYIYQLTAAGFRQAHKMILLK